MFSQGLAISPCPQPDKLCPQSSNLYLKDPFEYYPPIYAHVFQVRHLDTQTMKTRKTHILIETKRVSVTTQQIKKNSNAVPKSSPLAAIPHYLTSTGIYTHKSTYIPTKANRHVARDETVRLTECLNERQHFVSRSTAFSNAEQPLDLVRDVNTE
jgi:hypothetical protein